MKNLKSFKKDHWMKTRIHVINLGWLFFFMYMPQKNGFGFQDPATPVMEGIINFHNDLMTILIFVLVFVFYFLNRIMILFSVIPLSS